MQAPRRAWVQHLPALAALGILILGWTLLSWRRWPDLLIDYGRELYVPWRLSEGQVLYRDLAYHFGPLSARIGAALFRMLGAGGDTLFAANLLLCAAATLLTYALSLRWLPRIDALAVAACFPCLLGFSHLQEVGNYNFICPYSQPLTHGLLLAILAACCVILFLNGRGAGWMVAAHALLALAFLCKPETFVAAAAAVAAGWWCAGRLNMLAGWRIWSRVASCAGAALLPLAGAAILHPIDGSAVSEVSAWLTPYRLIAGMTPAAGHFYEQISGLHAPLRSLAHVVLITAAECAALIFLAGAVRLLTRMSALWRGAGLLAWAALCAAAFMFIPRTLWLSLPRALPVVMIVLIVVQFRRVRAGGEGARRGAALLVLAVPAAALLLKIALRVQLDHYGFALAGPATLISAGLALGVLPRALAGTTGGCTLSRAAVWMALATVVAWHSATSARHYALKTTPCGSGRDLLFADGQDRRGRNRVLIEAIEYVERHVPAGAGLAALPDWALLNYTTRRVNPGRFHTVNPFDVHLFGERTILADLQTHPPEYIALCARDTTELGAAFFGRDYAKEIYAWILQNYTEEKVFGTWPPDPERFGVQILRKK
jgi:hypothetical protein